VLQTDEGELLAESDAILFYFAEGTPFLPEGRLGRAHVLQWMFFDRNLQVSQNARA
jgi:glutathione S-transferase